MLCMWMMYTGDIMFVSANDMMFVSADEMFA